MAAFVFGNIFGLARQILTADFFGTRADIEAFNAANRVAETLFNLVAGGALASAFIPAFTGWLARSDRPRAWRLASAVANLVLLILIGLTLLSMIFAPWIVRNVLAPGFANEPQKLDLTVSLMRMMLPSAVIFGLSGLLMGVLNSNQVFFLPAIAPAMYQLGMILGILVLSPRIGIYGLAWGVLIGAGMHLLVQAPALLKLGGNYYPVLDLSSADVREVAALMGPRLLGVAVVQLNFWINTRLASGFVEGSVTALVLAFSLMTTPEQAIAQSIAIAAMPTFSAQVALDKLAEMRASLSASLRGALLLSIPATVGLILLRRPVVALLYQHGEFNEFSTTLVAWALLWYTAGLVGHSLVEILSRAFYSLHDTRTPVLIGILAMSLNVGFSYLFAAAFLRIGWLAHGGLALANSTATAVEAALLWTLMRRRLKGLDGRRLFSGAAQAGLAALAMAVGVWGWLAVTGNLGGPGSAIPATRTPTWLIAIGGMAAGATIYAVVILALGVSEAQWMVQTVKRRLAR